jgi:kynurenine formamidase
LNSPQELPPLAFVPLVHVPQFLEASFPAPENESSIFGSDPGIELILPEIRSDAVSPDGLNQQAIQEPMKIRTLIAGYVLALALFLFAQRHPGSSSPTGFHAVVDLTHSIDARYESAEKSAYQVKTVASVERDQYFVRSSSPRQFGTRIDAPAHFARGLWTVDQIPTERLIAPLVVLDVSANIANHPDYQISVEDIARWEQVHGQIPLGSVVMARTGWDSRWNSPRDYRNADPKGAMHYPGYSLDAAKFLVEGRTARSGYRHAEH